MKVISAENKIIGRLASRIASELRDGEEVRVVKSEEAVVSGDEQEVLAHYKEKKDRGVRHRGPYFPKRPDAILKRTVNNMLPDGSEGREQFSRLKTYLGEPGEFDEVEEVDVKEGDDLRNRNYVKLGKISRHIGWTPSGGKQ